ncbi:UDP-4-amino-4,6-dideoxy-N-acetyl-beta-L-altrosamine N-acetyltransferase [Paenibacillaceae bacterium]|nr:UDP-4-amino-4,6-dideoxy-N-acetyl-beta-L-altrosamine N-acetyltransferase [Paenibacillaceae bacterium]
MFAHEGYRLRAMAESDLEQVLAWRNSLRIRNHSYEDHMITMEEHLRWFAAMQQGTGKIQLIVDFDQTPIGAVNFTPVDIHGRCFWGIYLGDTEAPRGSALRIGYLGLRYAFELRGVRKLIAEILHFNIASLKFHAKLGFQEEGRFIWHVAKNDGYADVVTTALFQENWLAGKQDWEQLYLKSTQKGD